MGSVDSFKAKGTLEVEGQSYEIYRLAGIEGQETLPYSLKVLLENLLRTEDGANITADHIRAVGSWANCDWHRSIVRRSTLKSSSPKRAQSPRMRGSFIPGFAR